MATGDEGDTAAAVLASAAGDGARLDALWAGLRTAGGLAVARLLQGALLASRGGVDDAGALAAASHACWEKLHTGDWKDVAQAWRDAYSLAALLKHAGEHAGGDGDAAGAAALRALDVAALVGGPAFRAEVDRAIALVQAPLQAAQPRAAKRLRRQGDAALLGEPLAAGDGVPLPPASGVGGVSRAELPPLETFLMEHMLGEGTPVVITGLVGGWPAAHRWRDPAYLAAQAGARTVPVEVGPHYLAAEWRQELMPLSRFLEAHVLCSAAAPPPAAGRGYLAQHALFEQVPSLRADISTPDYCALGGGQLRAVNAWLGPAGTVTPLHHDPHHNILAQVVGAKYVRLYAPAAGGAGALYPHASGHCTNTSRVDVCAPDHAAFPRFAAAPYVDVELRAGEVSRRRALACACWLAPPNMRVADTPAAPRTGAVHPARLVALCPGALLLLLRLLLVGLMRACLRSNGSACLRQDTPHACDGTAQNERGGTCGRA
jgi:lysine-specific demethylase 8